MTVAAFAGLPMDARFKPHGVDHPQLPDTKGGVKRRLAPYVVGEARIGDFHHQKRVAAAQAL